MDQSTQQIKKGLLLFVLLLGSFLSVLNQTILNVALPDLMKQFEVSATTIQWLYAGEWYFNSGDSLFNEKIHYSATFYQFHAFVVSGYFH